MSSKRRETRCSGSSLDDVFAAFGIARDGETLAFGQHGDVWLLPRFDAKPRPLLQSRYNENTPAFSPDGHWMAFVSDESTLTRPGPKYRISTNGGTEPVWGRQGGELFFRNGSQMMVTAVTTQPRFAATTPKVLFSRSFAVTSSRVSYDVSPDGQRFIAVGLSESEQPVGQLNVVLHWTEELKRLVPTN